MWLLCTNVFLSCTPMCTNVIEVALWLHPVNLVYHWVAFTDTSSMISSMEVAVWLHAENFNRWFTFTVTSSIVSNIEVPLWLHFETLVNKWVAITVTSSRHGISSLAACWDSHWVTACSQRANTMLLIRLEVTEKVSHWLMRVMACSYFNANYHAGSVSESNSLVHKSHITFYRVNPHSCIIFVVLLLLLPCDLFWWKWQWKQLSGRWECQHALQQLLPCYFSC